MTIDGFVSLLIGRLAHWTKRLAGATGGGVMITFAVAFPVLLLAVGGAVDFGYMFVRQSSLQAAADAAALAGAKELQLANADEDAIGEITKASVIGNLKDIAKGVSVNTQVSFDARSVTVNASQRPGLFFLGGMAGIKEFDIAARATARVAGDMPICMLVLDDDNRGALAINNKARITGNECAVYSNSDSTSGIVAQNGSLLQAELTCSGGGFSGGSDNFKPMPLSDCPYVEDPLIARMPPPVGACTVDEAELDSGTHTLNPGVYCDGLKIGGTANVTLRPGVYVISDGDLTVSGESSLVGEGVGFYLTGDDAKFQFGPQTTVELSAPENGPMAGLLFFEDRNNDAGNRHTIRSNNARSMVGTFYLPRGSLVIDATKPVFDQSAYTVIVTRLMDMFSGPNLVLNSNYSDSDVPLPPEMEKAAAIGDEIVLAK